VTDHGDVGLARSGRREVRSAPSEASHRVIYKQWQILQRTPFTFSTPCSRFDIPAGAIVVFIPWCRGAEARAANQGNKGDCRPVALAQA
jgi:hypothetical protein